MQEILQYGALGILGVLVLFIVPFLIKFLVDFIRELRRDNQESLEKFQETINNHLDHETLAMNALIDAIERLCNMWENGK